MSPLCCEIIYKPRASFSTSCPCVLLQSKGLRERWLLDGAPAEEETQQRLHEDEVKTKLLEQVILRSASQKINI